MKMYGEKGRGKGFPEGQPSGGGAGGGGAGNGGVIGLNGLSLGLSGAFAGGAGVGDLSPGGRSLFSHSSANSGSSAAGGGWGGATMSLAGEGLAGRNNFERPPMPENKGFVREGNEVRPEYGEVVQDYTRSCDAQAIEGLWDARMTV